MEPVKKQIEQDAESTSLWGDAWRRLRQKRMAMVCLWIVGLYVGLALYGETVYRVCQIRDITPAYQNTNLDDQYMPPSLQRVFQCPEEVREKGVWRTLSHHFMGTDGLGRDVFMRLVQGTRVAFLVGIVTSLIAIPLGVVLGCLAGYFGGRIDDFVVWLYSTFAAIPSLLFILSISMVVGKGLMGVYLGIGFTTWVGICRLVRGEVIKHKERDYVLAGRALGLSSFRIIFRHILPNIFHVIIVIFTLRFPAAVGTEVFMSFLGLGVQGEPSWGTMIGSARMRLWQGFWWEMTFVTIAIFGLVLAFNLLGDALRDALDPRLRK
ncbi:MAG: ABC transporter permease [Kiritimatiellales bacterium]|nr:ABC transporter permease [Kiritimatiellales bacterium]